MKPWHVAALTLAACHGAARTPVTRAVPPATVSAARGEALFLAKGCYGCHAVSSWPALALFAAPGPDLTHVKAKLSREFIFAYLMNPSALRGTGTPPTHYLGAAPPGGVDLGASEETRARSLASYLLATARPWSDKPPPAQNPAPAAAPRPEAKKVAPQKNEAATPGPAAAAEEPKNETRGARLFDALGCPACHRLDDARDLGVIATKTSRAWISRWLKNPSSYAPHTRMPNFRLSDQEAAQLTAELMSHFSPTFEPRWPVLDRRAVDETEGLVRALAPDRETAEALELETQGLKETWVGERLFARYQCAGCHAWVYTAPRPARPAAALPDRLPDLRRAWLAEGRTTRRALVDSQSTHVWFEASADEADALARFLEREHKITTRAMATAETGAFLLVSLGCGGCHALRDAEPPPAIKGPSLAREGDRVQPDWLFHYLSRVRPLRPKREPRMPSFAWGDVAQERDLALNALIAALGVKTERGLAPAHTFEDAPPGPSDAAALERCKICHAGKDDAPPLAVMRAQLRPSFVGAFLPGHVAGLGAAQAEAATRALFGEGAL